jgi:hypothetical protein
MVFLSVHAKVRGVKWRFNWESGLHLPAVMVLLEFFRYTRLIPEFFAVRDVVEAPK